MSDTIIDQQKNHAIELDALRSEIERKSRNNLQLVQSLVRLRKEYPPATVAAALACTSGQIQMLTAIYDESSDGDCMVEIAPKCRDFVSSIAQGLVQPGTISLTLREVSARLPQRDLQSFGFAFVELLADASERAQSGGANPRIEVELYQEKGTRVCLRVRDDQASVGLPPLAVMLVEMGGGTIRQESGSQRTERVLSIEASIS